MTDREQMRLIEERVQIPQPPIVEALCEICSDLDVFDRYVVSTGSPYSRHCAQRDVLKQDLTLKCLRPGGSSWG